LCPELLLDGDDGGRRDVVRRGGADIEGRVVQIVRQIAGDSDLVHGIERQVQVARRNEAEVAAQHAIGVLLGVDVDRRDVVGGGCRHIDDRVDDAAEIGIERNGALVHIFGRSVDVDGAHTRQIDGRGSGRHRNSSESSDGGQSGELHELHGTSFRIVIHLSRYFRLPTDYPWCNLLGNSCSNGVYKRQC
jgi:hypothetical protein